VFVNTSKGCQAWEAPLARLFTPEMPWANLSGREWAYSGLLGMVGCYGLPGAPDEKEEATPSLQPGRDPCTNKALRLEAKQGPARPFGGSFCEITRNSNYHVEMAALFQVSVATQT
jgi:hypothetical protein